MEMTINLHFSLLFLASLSLGVCWEAPWFCHGYECPVYALVKQHEGFEERLYSESQWITTNVASTSDGDVKDGFRKLYYFMQETNKEKKTTGMTKPVVLTVNETEIGDSHVYISFFIRTNIILPEPNDETIKIKNLPAATIYVRVFDKALTEANVMENVEMLKGDLQAAGKPFDERSFGVASYDASWTQINIHNEVWIYAV